MPTPFPIPLIVVALLAPSAAPRDVIKIVSQIQRADFEGSRDALARLRGELTPFVDVGDRTLASRVLYWRGFALWRRAINGFNESVDKKEIADDLSQCAADFKAALAKDERFVDAKAGAASCLINFAFVRMGTDEGREAALESRRLVQEALAAEPDNPRLLWIHGANQYYTPPERGGGQALGLATYARALELARTQSRDRRRAAAKHPLEPRWGEAELLMALAFGNLNCATPDVAAAERYAKAALALVPYWHYVRDILLVQIQGAKSRAATQGAMWPAFMP
jgi:hypothetical protein